MKKKKRYLYITQADMERLRSLIEIGSVQDGAYLQSLEEELDHARIVLPEKIPSDVITMNSTVRLQDLDTGEEKIYTLVFPGKTEAGQNPISILAPVGTALIGYREGDVIEWDVPAGTRRLKVLEVVYQPERAGEHDL
ncbi:nucleoside diphosphate kinase regulator [Syntrophorhabdus aromaticivorans]|jgi:regulator of nucleoside diphosphate kinase|uniref:Nucleoside diphosphate kinase regulator n=1 Tax=Syntrophorhabdus aromaticivorans TaxID=328301 RepID=A0A351TZ48_9BACT|nr:nucleoside diphosphate kinase regulator [Syntrophorhabdus aromaticivorans]NLW33854.1 nucleoside diphosphate kinase regulator [Syntrophorhabdus aromaticivorans]HBA52979.1 nucleoside diphosphate kinase regulator [Syntrophorhabdus aromaticivorans]